jgi:hypothetical protein
MLIFVLKSKLGPASSAQSRIWFDEQILFNSNKSEIGVNNIPFVYRLDRGCTLSVEQLYNSIELILKKHETLRTSVIFDREKNCLMQHVNQFNVKLFSFISSIFQTDEELNDLIKDEQTNSKHFNLVEGFVFRCHFIYYKQINLNDVICDKDLIIFNFHEASFDLSSMNIFVKDLNEGYINSQLSVYDLIRYLDCKYHLLQSLYI